MPVFSGHTGVTNVELLIYIFLWGEGTISVIYWETHFILLFVRVGIFFFLGGGGVGGGGIQRLGQHLAKFQRDPTTHTKQPYCTMSPSWWFPLIVSS